MHFEITNSKQDNNKNYVKKLPTRSVVAKKFLCNHKITYVCGPNNVLTLDCLNRVASIEHRTVEEHLWNFNLQKRTRLQRFSAPKRVQNFDKIAQPQKGQFFQIWCKAIYNRSRYHLKSCVNTQGHGKFVLKIWMSNSIVMTLCAQSR